MNKITKSFLMLLLLVAGAVSAQAQDGEVKKDAWYSDENFRVKDYSEEVDEPGAQIVPRWTVEDVTNNGCMVMTTNAAAANKHDCQLWMRVAPDDDPITDETETQQILSFLIRADRAQNDIETQVHGPGWDYNTADNGWVGVNQGWGFNDGGKIDVNTTWKRVAVKVNGTGAYGMKSKKFCSVVLNLSDTGGDKLANTFYIDDVKLETYDKPDWYYGTAFYAKDYKEYEGTSYPNVLGTKFPEARFVTEGEDAYVEVVADPKANTGNTHNSQIWIEIPNEWVGKNALMTMDIKATENVEAPVSSHSTADGMGWGGNADFGANKLLFESSKWTSISRVLKTEGKTAKGSLSAARPVRYFVLDLSNGEGNIAYMFKNVKFGKAKEDWAQNNTITLDDGTTDPYVYGDDGYIKVSSAAGGSNKLKFTVPASLVGKNVKMTMKVKASAATSATGALLDGETPTAVDGVAFTAEWAPAEVILQTKNGSVYELTLGGSEAVDYYFDDVAFEQFLLIPDPYEAPALEETAQWYQDLMNQGVKLISVGEIGYNDGSDDDHKKEQKPARYVVDGDEEFVVFVSPTTSGRWDAQLFIQMGDKSADFPNGTKYTLSMMVKASDQVEVGTQGHYGAQQYWGYDSFGKKTFGTDWSEFKIEGKTVGTGDITHEEANPEYVDAETTPGVPEKITVTDEKGATQRTVVFDLSYAGDGKRLFFFKDIKLEAEKTVNPDDLEWNDDDLVVNGSLEGDKMDAFVAKIATEDDADPQILPVEAADLGKYAASQASLWPEGTETIPDGAKGIAINALKQSESGSAAETQLWVRLNKVIPAGTMYKVEFDMMSSSITEVPTQIDMNPGTNVSKIGIVKGVSTAGDVPVKAATAGKYVHYMNVCKAPEGGVGSIAFNLAGDKDYRYWFDNFSVKVVDDAETEKVDEDLWDATLELNVAVNAAKVVDTDGYSEESVKALEEAAKAGRELLDKADATKDALAAAAKDIEDAIAGLEYPYVEMPELDGSYIEIAQAQPTDFSIAATEAGEYNGDAYTTYTSPADVNVAFKMTDVDVTGCDKIYVYFAQPLKAGWNIAFWGIAGPAGVKAVDAGTEFIEFDLTEKLGDTEATYEQDGKTILKEVTLIDLWGATHPLTAKVYGVYKHEVAPELAYTDLTQEMFFQWSAADGTGEAINTSNCDLNLNQDTDQIYGLSTVDYDRFADLSEYSTIEVTTAATAEFEPRLLFNRIEDGGKVNQEVPRDAAKFETVVDNEDGTKTYIVDLAAIVAEQGYAHLHAIKRQGWSGTTNVTAIKLGYVGEQPSIPVPTAIEGVETADTVKDGKYFINGQIVIVKNGVKYNAAGVVIQ